jgi:hypothetical protein
MKEGAIILTSDEVLAALAGPTMEFRRAVKPQPFREEGVDDPVCPACWIWQPDPEQMFCDPSETDLRECLVNASPFRVGDRLRVRETWAHDNNCCDDHRCGNPDHIYYRASEEPGYAECFAGKARWRSPAIMPRAANRIVVEVTAVRVERAGDGWVWVIEAKRIRTE